MIRIDEELRNALEKPGDDFERVYRASVGGHTATALEVVSQTLALVAKAPRDPAWGGYLVVDQEQAQVVGTCGYKHGPEADGSVEIAYFTFSGFEGRGYATAMATELLRLALESRSVREVVAHTLPARNASTRILEKVGLRWAGETVDPEDGRVWRWEYRPGPPGFLVSLGVLSLFAAGAVVALVFDGDDLKALRVALASATYLVILVAGGARELGVVATRGLPGVGVFMVAGAGAGLVSGVVRSEVSAGAVLVQVLSAGLLLGGFHWWAVRTWRRVHERIAP